MSSNLNTWALREQGCGRRIHSSRKQNPACQEVETACPHPGQDPRARIATAGSADLVISSPDEERNACAFEDQALSSSSRIRCRFQRDGRIRRAASGTDLERSAEGLEYGVADEE